MIVTIKNLLSLFLWISSIYLLAQKKEMCITVNDLPLVSYEIEDILHEQEITEGLLVALNKHNVPAIGYVNEDKLYSNGKLDSFRIKLLERWLDEGHELGNHTYSHKNFNEVPFDEYTQEILNGEKIIRPLSIKYNNEIKYFRHPYLRIGKNKSHADSLNQFLKSNGYTVAPVTMNNKEYVFAKAHVIARKGGDEELMKKIEEAYLKYMEEQLEYFEKVSVQLMWRNISHTLMIRANFLNAKCLDSLLTIYEDHGYSFISQSEVLKDPAYQLKIRKYNDLDISWIQRWAVGQVKEGAKIPSFVTELIKTN